MRSVISGRKIPVRIPDDEHGHIVARLLAGDSQSALARIYGTGRAAINLIARRYRVQRRHLVGAP